MAGVEPRRCLVEVDNEKFGLTDLYHQGMDEKKHCVVAMEIETYGMDWGEHYYHMVVETKTYEAEPCQNLRLGNGQDLWGGYRLGGALLPHGGGDGDLGPLWSKPYGWETDKTLSVEIKT